jgi:hypothetical protein
MRDFRIVVAALPLALGACAGQGASQFQDASPSYAALSVDMSSAATAAGQAGALAEAGPAMLAPLPGVDLCHPHLFVRAEGLAMRLNFHLWKFLRHVDLLSLKHPDRIVGGHGIWHRFHDRIEVRWTVTQVSDMVFDFKLEARPAGSTDDNAWVAVFFGEIDRTGATRPHQGKGNATLDLTALHGVDPMEPATGEIDLAFETFSDHRKLVFAAKDVVWDFAADPVVVAMPMILRSTPRNAHFVYFREPGKGGSFKAHDEMAFACPIPAVGMNAPVADVKALSRWFVTNGAVHGRSDALVTGGLLPAANDLMGLTCHSATAEGREQAESYWFLKEEDATGATVLKWVPPGLDPSACDPAFGSVPSPDDSATDFDFSSVDFDSSDPAPFPGM